MYTKGRVSRDAEFLNRNVSSPSPSSSPLTYEYFGNDIRYTADGYPVKALDKCQQAVIISSDPAAHTSCEPGNSGKGEAGAIAAPCGQEA
ncbi:unnamed protein product [Diabrotica balteata]|uniref:Uncharacterized protein n=1 Tax=Diabrotica balteata TaxID=107213 RepID=A0A9N9SNJ0_DIABA|nr:unnamed protein product [Diabrotica balteata]